MSIFIDIVHSIITYEYYNIQINNINRNNKPLMKKENQKIDNTIDMKKKAKLLR